jgi:hypothetical protein
MAFTLTNGASTKVVDSAIQRDELVAMGWTESGSAHATNLPWNSADNVTNPTTGAFKGVGRSGEAYGSIGEAAIAATEGVSQAQYEALMMIARDYGDAVPNSSTYSGGLEVVTSLGTADSSAYSAAKVKVLKVKDTTANKDPGVYVVERGGTSGSYTYAWAEYTA